MIRRIRVNFSSAVFLSACINLTPLAPALATQDQSLVKVAFLGEYFEGLEEKVRDKISNDFLAMLQLEPSLIVKTPFEIEQLIGVERVHSLLKNLSKDSLISLGTLLDVDYVFVAKIANESKDPNQIILVGSFGRYDRWTGASYSYSILKFYQNFHEDLRVIKEQFVTSILPRKESILSKWPFFVVAGLAIVGIILLFFSKTGGGEEGDRTGEPIEG